MTLRQPKTVTKLLGIKEGNTQLGWRFVKEVRGFVGRFLRPSAGAAQEDEELRRGEPRSTQQERVSQPQTSCVCLSLRPNGSAAKGY